MARRAGAVCGKGTAESRHDGRSSWAGRAALLAARDPRDRVATAPQNMP